MAKSAVIIGGSLAGLMHGIMLKHHGYNVTILEQEPSTSRQGYDAGIKLGPNVLSFMKNHDRVNREYKIDSVSPVTFNADGKPKPKHKQEMTATSWGLFSSILRANFCEQGSKAVPNAPKRKSGDGEVVFRNGAKVKDLSYAGGKVAVHFEDITNGLDDTISADLVVVADGTQSSIRGILLPDVKRRYAGYICWRGTVPESEMDEQYNSEYANRFTFHFMNKEYIICYTVPTDEGDLEPGKRLHNWLWYMPLPEDSSEYSKVMTDTNGITHSGTVPRGLVHPKVWENLKSIASSKCPPGIVSMMEKSKLPFVTKVYDVTSSKASFFGGNVFLVGDALFTLRPNIGMSTQHAAYDCEMLEHVIEGTMTTAQWETAVLRCGNAQQHFAYMVASYGLGTKLQFILNALRWGLLLLGQNLGLS
ncbi:FAD/NAD(P)-binding domain-containing protein [Pleomassaria siparia CBS 279.74]|uniref:FAD/NAD(P)-binding domain-containing protein n=1 Tax=Pleomassaria siparia CBS 279.74 TaxID=1314801 RepID=A0A6G1JZ02_9PLEO|nr:FAD/NAD(P)-binding domain-containing protein [Pleomassaria siparia CBS 279.74]